MNVMGNHMYGYEYRNEVTIIGDDTLECKACIAVAVALCVYRASFSNLVYSFSNPKKPFVLLICK